MTLRNIIGAIAIGLVMLAGSTVVSAGNSQDNTATKKGTRSAALKQGEKTQGTFAFRFNTYQSYVGETECNAATSPSCATSLNDDLRSGGITPDGVKPTDAKKPSSTSTLKRVETPTND